jgi:hypothetical protein
MAPLIYAGGNMEDLILRLINSILKTGQIPDILKVGLVTPIFKNNGDKNTFIGEVFLVSPLWTGF